MVPTCIRCYPAGKPTPPFFFFFLQTDISACCGDWTRDGRYYIFEVLSPAST